MEQEIEGVVYDKVADHIPYNKSSRKVELSCERPKLSCFCSSGLGS